MLRKYEQTVNNFFEVLYEEINVTFFGGNFTFNLILLMHKAREH